MKLTKATIRTINIEKNRDTLLFGYHVKQQQLNNIFFFSSSECLMWVCKTTAEVLKIKNGTLYYFGYFI